MGILDELSFFSDLNVEFYYPFFLVFLNVPSLIYELFPIYNLDKCSTCNDKNYR